MKKLINNILGTALVIMLSSVILIGFAGCKSNTDSGTENKSNTDSDKEGTNSGTDTQIKNIKSTDLIKFNISNAGYLATQRENGTSGREAGARAAATKTTKTLIAVTKDNKIQEEPVIVISSGIEVSETETITLKNDCELPPVLEVYKCPYSNVEEEAKGVYTVFKDKIDWWHFEDGSPAPHIGQIMYAKPDGTTKDILNFDNDVNRYICTYIKENNGEDYIQFDENGNIFILVHENSNNKYLIYRYNPVNDAITSYTVDIEGELLINNFKITRNGKWIFLNVMINRESNNVYALQVNSNAKPITMYEFDSKTVENNDEVWGVSSIGINPKTNDVYWYVNEYTSYTRANSGLYVASMSTSGSYSKEDVQFYYGLDEWNWNRAVEYFVTKDDKKDYSGLLDYLKSFCRADRKTENIEFSLLKFKDMTQAPICNPYNDEKIKDFSKLYKEDENGKVLKDEAALKYLFETKYVDIYPESLEWSWETAEADRNRSLWESLFKDFIHYYYNYSLLGDKFFDFNSNVYWYAYCHFPFDFVMFKKGSNETIEIDSAYLKYMNGVDIAATCDKGIILANDEGVWVYKDYWGDNEKNNTFAQIFKLADDKGNFKMTEPGNLSELNKKENGFKVAQDFSITREETDPWYKKPFATNTKGFAAISKDQKTIYYHSNGVTKDLLEKDTNKNSITAIYSFNLDNNKLIYNAVKLNGGYLMVSIDLVTGTATKLPIDSALESMLSL